MQVYSFKSTQPRDIGHEHGEVFRESIQEISEIRLEMLLKEPNFNSKSDALNLAQKHLSLFKKYDPDLFLEFLGISESSNTSLEKLIILNHFTDLRDIDGCTVIFVPSPSGPLFGQTWDIHGTAINYVRFFEINNTLILSITGCLGMCGFNQDNNLAVCINNLASLDAKVGLVWPALVRKVLKSKNAKEAKDLVLEAPLGSGHHYSIADKYNFYGIETSGALKKLMQTGGDHIHFHTNHALDPKIAQFSTLRPASTTHVRFETVKKSLAKHQPENLDQLWELFSKVSMPIQTDAASQTATCGALAMNLHTNETKYCRGPVTEPTLLKPLA